MLQLAHTALTSARLCLESLVATSLSLCSFKQAPRKQSAAAGNARTTRASKQKHLPKKIDDPVATMQFDIFLLGRLLHWLVRRHPDLAHHADFRKAVSHCMRAERLWKRRSELSLSQILEQSDKLIKSGFASLRQVINTLPPRG